MTNILFGTAIGIAMSVAILGNYRWLLWHGHVLRPSRKVRDLVDEYARLTSELKCADTERGKAIWDRKCDVAIKLAEMDYVLYETGKAAYVFPIDDYYVATFGEAPAQAAVNLPRRHRCLTTSRQMIFKLTVDVAEYGPTLGE